MVEGSDWLKGTPADGGRPRGIHVRWDGVVCCNPGASVKASSGILARGCQNITPEYEVLIIFSSNEWTPWPW
jgi:hypothetical protein